MTQTASKPQQYKPEVRGQYEDFPYPLRDPEKEGDLYYGCDPHSLLALSHAGWGGRRDLRVAGTRVLVAGCGTGDGVVYLAEELLGHDVEIVAIDLSSKSLDIARARLAKRQLSGVTFHHMSILDAPSGELGMFDYIECSGVLHHLPDPNAGLAALAQLLADDGMMNLMVYGQYGRLSIYLVQALMKQLMTEQTPRTEKIAIAREFLNHVPEGHWLTVKNEGLMQEINWPDGSGIYDLFLHSTDRSYTVPELYEWVEGAGLQLTSLFGPFADGSLYLPESYNGSARLKDVFAQKTLRERQTIAELMNGNIGKHYLYAAKTPRTQAEFADDMVMSYGPTQHFFLGFREVFMKGLGTIRTGERYEGLAVSMGLPLFVTKTPHAMALMGAVDGHKTIGAIVAEVAKAANAAEADVRRDLVILYNEYRTRQVVFLRHHSIPPYTDGPSIEARVRRVRGRG